MTRRKKCTMMMIVSLIGVVVGGVGVTIHGDDVDKTHEKTE